MPYRSIEELPKGVKNNLPHHAQEIYKEAFNNAEKEYGEGERAAKVAWAAVKDKYIKADDGEWVEK